MLMACFQIIASDVAVTMGGAEGNFELNAFRPILIDNYLHSALITGDMRRSIRVGCASLGCAAGCAGSIPARTRIG
jgi:fumarate hydratase class II